MQYMFALDLKDDPALIAEYEREHQRIWPEIAQLLHAQGVAQMEIFRLGPRLVMRMETDTTRYDPESFARVMAESPINQAWEARMSRFQQATPWTDPSRKWEPMQPIFDLKAQL